MKHLTGNQYSIRGINIILDLMYDTDCLVLYKDLSTIAKENFGCSITPSEKINQLVERVRGLKVYGNNNGVVKYSWEFRGSMLSNCLVCHRNYDTKIYTSLTPNFEKEDLLAIVKDLSNFIENNDIMSISYQNLIKEAIHPTTIERVNDWYKEYIK